jgi:hypothetical protein
MPEGELGISSWYGMVRLLSSVIPARVHDDVFPLRISMRFSMACIALINSVLSLAAAGSCGHLKGGWISL